MKTLGSKQKLSRGRWRVRVSLGRDSNGKRRYKTATVYGSEADADSKIRELYASLSQTPVGGVSMDEYFYLYFLPMREDLEASTLAQYRWLWTKHLSPWLGKRELSEPSHSEIQDWIKKKPRSIGEHGVRLLRTVLRSAWYDHLLETEPMRRPFRYPKKTEKLRVWSPSEVMEVIDRLEEDALLPLVLVMVGGGLRREEALALDWSDIHFSSEDFCRVSITKAITRYSVKSPKTFGSIRVVAIGEPFASKLFDLRGDGAICPSRQSERMSAERLPRHWRRLFEEGQPLEGITYIPLMRLRHTHETLMHQAAVPDSAIAHVHGHSDFKTDFSHYIASTDSVNDRAAILLGDYLAENG